MKKEPEELVRTRIGRKFWIYRDDSFYRQRVANAGPYQKHNLVRLRELVPNARVILDVGMNIGMNTVEYATWAKEVHGFEPTKQTFEMAVRNLALAKNQNPGEVSGWHKKPDGSMASCEITGNVVMHHVAIGGRNGAFKLVHKKNNAGQNFIDAGTRHYHDTEKVTMRTIDSFRFKNVDAIKIDVEGFEFQVVLGAAKTIGKYRPVVQLEILEQHARRVNVTPQDIYNWFLRNDYKILLSDGTDAGETWQKVRNKMDRFFVPRR